MQEVREIGLERPVEYVRRAGEAMPVEMLATMDAATLVSRFPKFTRVDFGGVAAPKGPLKSLIRKDPRIAEILSKLSNEELDILGQSVFDICSDMTTSIRKRCDSTLNEVKRRLGVAVKKNKLESYLNT